MKVLHSVQKEEASTQPTTSRDMAGRRAHGEAGPVSLVQGAGVGGQWHRINQVHR